MHLFRWTRFLSWRRQRPSTPRRSSRWLLRHFHRSGSSRASLEAPGLSVGSSFDMRPSLIYVDQAANANERLSREEEDRKFIDEFHRSVAVGPHSNGPLSPRSSQALARVSSLFHTTGRSTILERASIVNMFNQLQFEMPPLPREPAPPDDTALGAALETPTSPECSGKPKKTRSQKRLAKRKLKKMQRAGSMATAAGTSSYGFDSGTETGSLLASTEPSFFRQYMMRAKSKTFSDESKLRPMTSAECRAYVQRASLNPPTIGSQGDLLSPPGSPAAPEPMQFLFFGGCTEENPHGLREVDWEPRRYRARFVASQPAPSSTASIHIKPTLVRGLPSVFEPRFESMYI